MSYSVMQCHAMVVNVAVGHSMYAYIYEYAAESRSKSVLTYEDTCVSEQAGDERAE